MVTTSTPILARTRRRFAGAGASLVTVLALGAGPAAPAQAASPAPGEQTAATAKQAPGTYVGKGFDACTAPSNAAMQAWLASPYRAVGIYFGGINRACLQPNLTPQWVTTQQAAGWTLMPLYVGLQAPCTSSTKPNRIDPANAAAQGRAEAEDAVARAKALGLPEESVLIFDMEAYSTTDAVCRQAVLTFLSAWTARLHDLKYLSGFYSSMSSGVADQVAVYNAGDRVHPDYVDFARWDNVVTVTDVAIPAGYWSPNRRIKQYLGDHNETWGGVTINIDNDYLEVAPLPRTPFGDFTGNGWSDLIARQTTTGRLIRYAGNGSFVGGAAVVGNGWNSMNAITRLGDLSGDGIDDILSRTASTGELWLYPGNGAGGHQARIRMATGWNVYREITPVGDLDQDGRNDVLAVRTSSGILYAFRGRAGSLAPGISLGSGWNTVDELTGVGDFNRDGFVDLLARLKSNGDLYLYPGQGVGFKPRVKISAGWSGRRSLTSIGDIDRDGFTDLVAVVTSSNGLYRWLGRGTSLGPGVRIGVGWSANNPLL